MVRNNELNAARRGAADKARARQQVRSQMTGTLVGIDPEDSRRVIVSFDGSEVSVLAGPDKLVPGSLVAVEVDALGAPVRVVGAVTVRPAGLDEGMPAPLPVVAMPELAAREMTEAERLAIIETEQGLADARADLEDARVEAETNFGTLNDKLGQAMSTADGKNTTSYKTVTTTPGPAPTNAVEGKNRRQYDMHRNRLSNGTVVGEWMWSGTSWVQVHMGDGVLRSLDVGKLSAGTADLETAVANKLWANLAVVQRLEVQQSAYIDGVHIKNGAVTAPALNVVHTDPGTGYGFRMQPEGITMLDAQGNTAIALRTDMQNYFAVMEGGQIRAAISPEGGVSGRTVAANVGLTYRGEELSKLLSKKAGGVLARSTNRGGEGVARVGNNTSRLAGVSLTTPETNRNIRISFEGRMAMEHVERRLQFTVRQSANPFVRPDNSSVQTWLKTAKGNDEIHLSYTTTVDELTWPYGTPITVGVFAETVVSGEQAVFNQYGQQQLVIEDLGPAVSVQVHSPYVPDGGGGVPTGTRDEHLWRERTVVFMPSWGRAWADGTVYDSGPFLHQGVEFDGTVWKSQAGYDTAAISALCNGADMVSARLRINNVSADPKAMAPNIWAHSRTSASNVYSKGQFVLEADWARGQDQWADISHVMELIKSGSIRGFGLEAVGAVRESASVFADMDLELTVRK